MGGGYKDNETVLYKEFKNILYLVANEYGIKENEIHHTRIESPSTWGIPDINICARGKEIWVECKVKNNTISASQNSWQEARRLAGGIVYNLHKKESMYIIGKVGCITSTFKALVDAIRHVFIEEEI